MKTFTIFGPSDLPVFGVNAVSCKKSLLHKEVVGLHRELFKLLFGWAVHGGVLNSSTNVKREHPLPSDCESSTNAASGLLDASCCASSSRFGGIIPFKFTDAEKQEVIAHIRTLGPQYQNTTVILDKNDVPEDLLGAISFADRDEEEIEYASRQYLSLLRQHNSLHQE